MKRLTAILLTLVFIFATFAGCKASENTDTDIPVGNMNVQLEDEDTPSDITETESSAETETETDTEKSTETTTTETSAQSTSAKETTTKKAETTAKSTTTKKAETTKKETTTKKKETTTQKSTTTTTSHTHSWTAHYAEREVLVQEGFYSETIITPQYHVHETGYKCYTCGKEWGAYCPVCGAFTLDQDLYPHDSSVRYEYDKHCNETGHPVKSRPTAIEKVEYGDPIVTYDGWVDPIYETEKYIDYYTCSCGAKKNA